MACYELLKFQMTWFHVNLNRHWHKVPSASKTHNKKTKTPQVKQPLKAPESVEEHYNKIDLNIDLELDEQSPYWGSWPEFFTELDKLQEIRKARHSF